MCELKASKTERELRSLSIFPEGRRSSQRWFNWKCNSVLIHCANFNFNIAPASLRMVMKMNEPTVTETIDAVPANTTTVTITLHPQPIQDIVCDNASAITTETGETTLSNISPSSDDTESLQNSQMMVKKSLKLELTHNNNDIKSLDTGSPVNEDDLSFKSPSSPRTCKHEFRSLPPPPWMCSQTNRIFSIIKFLLWCHLNSSSKPLRSTSDVTHVPSRGRRRSKGIARCALPGHFPSASQDDFRRRKFFADAEIT